MSPDVCEKAFHFLPLPVFVVQDGYFRYVNPKMVEISGYSREELLTRPCMELVYFLDREMVENYSSLRLSGKAPETYLFRVLNPQGEVSYLSIFFSNIEYDGRAASLGQFVDITSQTKVSNELNIQKVHFQQLFLNSPHAIAMMDDQDRFVEINGGFEKLFQYSIDEIRGIPINDVIVPEDFMEDAFHNSKTVFAGGVIQEDTVRKRKDGSLVNVSLVGYPVVLDNKHIGMYAIYEDITERKTAEKTLFKEKERLAVTLTSIGDAVIAVDRSGRVTIINPVAQSLTGWSEGEALGRPLEEIFIIVNEYTGEPVENPVQKVLEEGQTVGLANHTSLISRDGTVKSIADSAAPICDQTGEMLGVILVFRDMTLERQKEEALRKSEERFRSMVESTDDWVWEVDPRGVFTYVSPQIKDMLGYSPEEVVGRTVFHLMAKEEARRVNNIFRSFADQLKSFRSFEIKVLHKDRFPVFMETNGVPFFSEGEFLGYFGIIRDITQRRLAAEKLAYAHQQLQDIIEFLPDATFVLDQNRIIIAWNRAIEEMSGAPKEDMIGRGDFAYAIPFYGEPRPVIIDLIFSDDVSAEGMYDYVERKGSTLFAEVFISTLNKNKGGYIWVKASPLIDRQGNFVGAICSIRDITQRKEIEDRLKYLSLHDSLTGLYNRTYFEEEMRRLEGGNSYPLSIILCDVDGLKLVNDSLGHSAGDTLLIAAADVSRRSFDPGVIVSRIGGDEFAILLPGINRAGVESCCAKMRENVNCYNDDNPDLPLSLSIGFSTAVDSSMGLGQVFKDADNNMYREKLHHSQSARSVIVSTLMKALEARDFITEGHGDRIQDLVEDMALVMGLSERKANELRLFAQFHDIGKVGIPDRILFKAGPLTEEEYNEMKRHCEIGFRIAQSAPDLASIADWVLKHHEWWNGNGYPLRLKGDEIPLECRILSIADAYDAMTSDRPYRKAIPKKEALAELERCSEVQFDPILVKVFIKLLEGQ
ncbi:MAG TPA: hypothetical protein DEF36_04085 [Desulfotomaculum sp.]|nr:hypothetical protein [Desulfotomaculum sp.]